MTEVNASEAIRRASLGSELDDEESRVLTESMQVRQLQDGDTLVSEDDDCRTLFLLIQGEMAVVKRVGHAEETVYVMKAGECAGTRAFVDGSRRRATLRAIGKATLLTLEPETFEALLESHPRIVFKVMRGIFRETHRNLMRMNLESAELKNYVMKLHGRY